MAQINPINYSTRDFITLLAQINADPNLVELSQQLKASIAGPFDVLNNMLNVQANALFSRTAFSRPEAQDLYHLIDYALRWKSPASAPVTVTVPSSVTASSNYTVSRENLVAQSPATALIRQLQWEARADLTILQGQTTGIATMYQQETQSDSILGVSDGSDWQRFDLPFLDIIRETVTISDGTFTYSPVLSLTDYTSTSNVFKLYYKSDGSSYIQFGGSDPTGSVQRGRIPANGAILTLSCAVGGGSDTNVAAGAIQTYIGNDSNVDSVLGGDAAGGTDEESLVSAFNNSVIQARTIAFWSNNSNAQAIARNADPGVFRVFITPTDTRALFQDVYVMPYGGGNPTSLQKTNVETALIKASFLEQVVLTMFDPGYVNAAIAAAVHMLPGYVFAERKKYLQFAVALKTHESGLEILDNYPGESIEQTLNNINAILGSYLDSPLTINDDLSTITKILDNIVPSDFGLDLDIPSDIDVACGFVPGTDFVTVSLPAATVPIGSGQIFHPTSITITEITP